MNGSLFPDPPSNGPHVGVPDWERLRDDAMAAVSDKAESVAPGFTGLASTFVLAYLAQHGAASSEQITDACKRAGILPHDDRAFGPVYYQLSRRGLIRKVGECLRAKGHGTSGGNIWELAPSDGI